MPDLKRHDGEVVEQTVYNFEVPAGAGGGVNQNLIIGVLRRWYIVLLVFLVMCAIGVPAIWLSIKPLYTVAGRIWVHPVLPNILTGDSDQGEISNYYNFMNTQAQMITSARVVQRAADQLAERNLAFFNSEANDPVSKLKRRLKHTEMKHEPAAILKQAIARGTIQAAPRRNTELLEVTMNSINSEEARHIVNAFIDAYMAVEVIDRDDKMGKKLAMLENERRLLEEDMQRRYDTILQLAQEYGTTALSGRQDMMLQRVTQLLAELTKVEARRINLEAQVQLLKQTKEQTLSPQALLKMRNEYINADTLLQELTKNIVQLEQDLIAAKQELAPENPALKRKQGLLDAFQLRLEQRRKEIAGTFDEMVSEQASNISQERLLNAQAELEQTKAYEKRLNEVLSQEDEQTKELGRKHLNIQREQVQLDLNKEKYQRILQRIDEEKMKLRNPGRVEVASRAEIASVADKRMKYTMALMFGAMACGAMLALWRDKADLSLHTPNDIVKRIGCRIIGTTADLHDVKRETLPRQVVEDYQTIRANLDLLNGDGMPKKLVVTSPGMKEGKTTFAINLATSLAKSGKKVLLIDGDLRKPDIANLLNLPNGSRGLQDLLFGKTLDRAVYSVPSTGLDVLSADFRNRTDAYELLATSQTTRLMDAVSQKYDHVIIDTPPVLAFPDALLWAKNADAVVLMSFAGKTTTPDLKETMEKLTQMNVRVLGTVLGKVRTGHSYYRYGYNYYYSGNGQQRRRTRKAHGKLLLPAQDSEKSSNDPNS